LSKYTLLIIKGILIDLAKALDEYKNLL